jgi:RNA polymerase sigma factor (sigma-70 family)
VNTWTDQQLLGEYAKDRSEAAFRELARRHVDLTYSVALRILRDPHLAQDVTQAVFVALAQNAAQLASHPVLSGWLHRATRNVAAQTVRSEVRRRAREQEAATMNELLSPTAEPAWDQIAPQLDAALAELDDLDRDAVLLRYFEKKSAQEMGDILGVSAEAAQKRVSRAVEQLRGLFARRGVALSAGALALLLSSNAVQAAPAGLAATVSTAATLAGTAAASAATVAGTTLGATSTALAATKAVGMTLLQKVLVASTIAALAGFGFYEARQASQLRQQVRALESQQVAKDEQIRQLAQTQPPIAAAGVTPALSDRPPATDLNGVAPGNPGFAPPFATAPTTGSARQFMEQAQKTMEQMTAEQRNFMDAHGGNLLGGGGVGMAGLGGAGQTGNALITTKSVNGNTVIVYRGQEFPVGQTRGFVTTKAATIQGKDYAAAFDGDKVLWENVPGAARQLK